MRRPLLLAFIVVLARASVSFAEPAAPKRTLVFRGSKGLLAFDPASRKIEPIDPPGYAPIDASISLRQDLIAFTAFDRSAGNQLLYVWRRADNTVKRVGGASGFHSSPAFASDGSRIFFSYNAKSHGKNDWKDKNDPAQLYSVRPDGSGLTRLTDGTLCHFDPRPVTEGDRVLFVITPCVKRWSLAVLDLGTRSVTELLKDEELESSPSLSPSQKRAVFVVPGNLSTTIKEFDFSTHASRTLAAVESGGVEVLPQYGVTDDEVFFETVAGVWRLVSGKRELVLPRR